MNRSDAIEEKRERCILIDGIEGYVCHESIQIFPAIELDHMYAIRAVITFQGVL